MFRVNHPSVQYHTHIMIVNDVSSINHKFEVALTDDARVVIYDHHMFIVQATGLSKTIHKLDKLQYLVSFC